MRTDGLCSAIIGGGVYRQTYVRMCVLRCWRSDGGRRKEKYDHAGSRQCRACCLAAPYILQYYYMSGLGGLELLQRGLNGRGNEGGSKQEMEGNESAFRVQFPKNI